MAKDKIDIKKTIAGFGWQQRRKLKMEAEKFTLFEIEVDSVEPRLIKSKER